MFAEVCIVNLCIYMLAHTCTYACRMYMYEYIYMYTCAFVCVGQGICVEGERDKERKQQCSKLIKW